MAVSAKTQTLTILFVASAALLPTGAARAQQAGRCEGTLCDFYYGARGNAPAQPATTAAAAAPGVPAGATPLTAPSGGLLGWFKGGASGSATGAPAAPSTRPPPPPSEEASATNSYMHMGTNGLLGDGGTRCSGTICDTFYGSSPAVTKPGIQQAAAGGAAPAEPRIAHRHIVHETETRPKCSSPTADPWHCFR